MMGTGPCAGPGPGSEQYLWFYGHNLGTGAWCPGRRGLPVLQGFLPPALQEKEEPPESISPLRLRKPLLPQPLGKFKKKTHRKCQRPPPAWPPTRSPSTSRGWEGPGRAARGRPSAAARGSEPRGHLSEGRRDKGPPERAPPAPAPLNVVHEVLPKHTLQGQGLFLTVI